LGNLSSNSGDLTPSDYYSSESGSEKERRGSPIDLGGLVDSGVAASLTSGSGGWQLRAGAAEALRGALGAWLLAGCGWVWLWLWQWLWLWLWLWLWRSCCGCGCGCGCCGCMLLLLLFDFVLRIVEVFACVY
jgi:hypothetical protein